MTDSDRVVRIRAYLEQYCDTYDREALRRRLIADGHPLADIDLAMAQVYGFEARGDTPALLPAAPAANDTTTRVVLLATGIVLLNIALGCGTFFAALQTLVDSTTLWLLIAAGALLPMVFEGIAAVALRGRNTWVSNGLKWGVVVSLALLVLAALLFGACIALLSGSFS